MQDVLNAEIDALNAPGSVATVALQSLLAQISGSPTVKLSDLFDLGVWQSQGLESGNAQTALQTALNVYQLTTLAAQVADGANFANIQAVSVPLGLATLTMQATVIEPPQHPAIAFGPVGATVHTSQVRLKLDLTVPVTDLLKPLLGNDPIHLPLYVEVAEGDARLSQITCSFDPATGTMDPTVTIDATPGLAKAYIGLADGDPMTNFSDPVTVSPAPILDVNLLGLGLVRVTVSGDAEVSSGPGVATPLVFTQDDIYGPDGPKKHTATSNDRLLATLLPALINTDLEIKIVPLGLGISTGAVSTALSGLLQPVFDGLDTVIGQVMAALGVSVGYLDVTATGVRCGAPVLVN
jgi:uncharacterized membrane protein